MKIAPPVDYAFDPEILRDDRGSAVVLGFVLVSISSAIIGAGAMLIFVMMVS